MWGMAFTADAAPQTPLAVGNPAGPYTNFTVDQMKGADAVFGSDNVAVLLPVTDPWAADGPFKGVSGGGAGAGGGTADPPKDPLTNLIVPIGKVLGSAADQVFLGGGVRQSQVLGPRDSQRDPGRRSAPTV